MHKYDLREREIQERPHFDKYKVGWREETEMFGFSKIVSPVLLGHRFPLATRFSPASESSCKLGGST